MTKVFTKLRSRIAEIGGIAGRPLHTARWKHDGETGWAIISVKGYVE